MPERFTRNHLSTMLRENNNPDNLLLATRQFMELFRDLRGYTNGRFPDPIQVDTASGNRFFRYLGVKIMEHRETTTEEPPEGIIPEHSGRPALRGFDDILNNALNDDTTQTAAGYVRNATLNDTRPEWIVTNTTTGPTYNIDDKLRDYIFWLHKNVKESHRLQADRRFNILKTQIWPDEPTD